MRSIVWGLLGVVLGVYLLLVTTVGFVGPVALAIHFSRVSLSVAVLLLYMPTVLKLFRELPVPRRDFLLAGILATWLSGVGFTMWNGVGRVLHVDTSVFTSPIAGFFSLLLVVGAVFHLTAPSMGTRVSRCCAIAIGVVVCVGLMLLTPLLK